MTDVWTPRRVAEELLRVFPSIGRVLSPYVQSADEADMNFMQARALFYLLERPITASDLARKRKVSLQSASVLVQGLVERGWVQRIPNPHDRRQFLLEVTPEGRRRAEETGTFIANYVADHLGGLTAEEMAAAQIFIPALQRVLTEPRKDQQDCPTTDDWEQPIKEEEITSL